MSPCVWGGRGQEIHHDSRSVVADEVPHQRKSGEGVGVGAVHLDYNQEVLGFSDKSESSLRKAEELVLTAVY